MKDLQPIILDGINSQKQLLIAGPCSAETEEQIIKTYEITESELKLYTKVNYDKGKADPFSKYSETPSGNVITGGSTSGNTNTNSTGSFFENGSTK